VKGRDVRKVGLARALSKLGYCSRSQAVALIRSGRVRLNGVIRRDPETPVREEKERIEDRIDVDGMAVDIVEKIYLVLNKPRGVVTTASDEKGRETVYDLLGLRNSKENSWLAPVGRLDKASEGLLLLTNDSEWGAQVTAPETHLDKTYHVQLGRIVGNEFVRNIVAGVRTEGEMVLRAKAAHVLRVGQSNCWLEIVLDEGKNRQIRKIMEALEVEILRLVRVAIGPLQLGNLPKGQHRKLTEGEKRMLDRAMREKNS
jgi:23S rRNA pseudouridine2605 synthase